MILGETLLVMMPVNVKEEKYVDILRKNAARNAQAFPGIHVLGINLKV
jgi:hypothetical protein